MRGVPVLGYNIRGVNDIIINEYNGFLFYFNEDKKIINTIHKLHQNTYNFQKLIDNSIATINESYASKNINKKINSYFKDIFNDN